ncbi:hypothetical protein GCM10009630_31710 [Kribbella jejuensis]|uniref:Uncharacterized protein n=1 Tax=Kribbella jejuensis TaxID=236068 RepID=A0A542DTP7_9ACTN|nr:hypothetical protein [Kribbella jejuensis]TQJ06480.1 hypothetical protein FB475_6142 [Kribbella jejuensis]
MAATKSTRNAAAATEALKQITYLAAALKAPRITEAAARLADQARDAGWTHEVPHPSSKTRPPCRSAADL